MKTKLMKSLLSAAALSILLAGCSSSAAAAVPTASASVSAAADATPSAVPAAESASPADVRVSAMKGPTAMGMVELMHEADEGQIDTNNYSFQLLDSVDEIAPLVAQSQVDIASVPANLASVLYNNTDGGVEVLAINTLGVLYICETGDSVHSVADLKGKTIYASGKGATPEYALDYILEGNGIDPDTDVTIEWESEHAECVAALAKDPAGIAMLPQPFVTAAQAQNDAISVRLNLSEEWDKLQENAEQKSQLITGVVIGRKEFIDNNPDAVKDFLSRYEASINYVNSNTKEASELIGSYDIIAQPVAEKALPYCNIVYIAGDEMKTALSGYLNVLYEANPKSVGGAMPGDDFYYLG